MIIISYVTNKNISNSLSVNHINNKSHISQTKIYRVNNTITFITRINNTITSTTRITLITTITLSHQSSNANHTQFTTNLFIAWTITSLFPRFPEEDGNGSDGKK